MAIFESYGKHAQLHPTKSSPENQETSEEQKIIHQLRYQVYIVSRTRKRQTQRGIYNTITNPHSTGVHSTGQGDGQLIPLINLLLSLPLHILPLIVNLPPLVLLLAIPRESSTHAAHGSLGTVHSALTQVFQVLAGLRLLAGLVLLDALLAERVDARQVADGFLGRADGLVPCAGVCSRCCTSCSTSCFTSCFTSGRGGGLLVLLISASACVSVSGLVWNVPRCCWSP